MSDWLLQFPVSLVSFVVFSSVLYISVTVHCWLSNVCHESCLLGCFYHHFSQFTPVDSCLTSIKYFSFIVSFFWSCVHFFFKVGFFSLSVSLMTLVKCVQGLLSAVPCLKNCLFYKYPPSMSCVQFCPVLSPLFLACVYCFCLLSIVLYLLFCVDCPISFVLCILSFVSYLLSCVHLSIVLR